MNGSIIGIAIFKYERGGFIVRILMLSWEYPPKGVGGLSNHVYYLSQSLSKLGHEVHVITSEEDKALVEEEESGVFVHRVIPYSIDTEDFTKWVMHLNFAIVEEGIKIINSNGRFDIIHGHDWLSVYAAKTLKSSYNIPMVCTIHATEHGRNNGIRTKMQKYISSAEWIMTYEAWKVIACSEYMRDEIHNVFNTPLDKLSVIPNGVSIEDIKEVFDAAEFRKTYARIEEKVILLEKSVGEKAYGTVLEKYTWNKIAIDTVLLYENVKEEAKGTEWEVPEPKIKKKPTAARKKKIEESAIEEIAADVEEAKHKAKRTRKKA
jgi:glycogen synthase